jgi:hypothetical protein
MPNIFQYFKRSEDDEKAGMLVKPLVDWTLVKFDTKEIASSKASEGEKQVLINVLNKGFPWGLFGGVASMLLLRYAPRYLARRFTRPAMGVQEAPITPPSTNAQGFMSVAGGAIDLSMGVLWGGLIWYSATPVKFVYDQAAQIPLLPGRSHISDALCTDTIRYYQESPKQLWIRYGKNHDVEGWKKMIDSCRRRQKYEEQMRKQMGYTVDQPVEIPEPGIPKDLILDDMT